MPTQLLDSAAKDRVVAVLDRLRSSGQEVSVDLVDGEFYWRCCRLDFVADIEAIRRMWLPNPISHLRPGQDYLEALFLAYGVPQPAALEHIIEDAPIAIREPAFSLHCYDDEAANAVIVDRLSLKVPTPSWNGRDVAARVRGFLDVLAGAGFRPIYPEPTAGFSLRLDADVVTVPADEDDVLQLYGHGVGSSDQRPWRFLSYGSVPAPFLRLVVWYPWPPAGLVGDFFDAALAAHPEWRRAWRGWEDAAEAQSPQTAMRTWAVGLLMRAGFSWRDAMSIACEEGGVRPIERPGFTRDRDRLVRRVPESRPFVYPPRFAPNGL